MSVVNPGRQQEAVQAEAFLKNLLLQQPADAAAAAPDMGHLPQPPVEHIAPIPQHVTGPASDAENSLEGNSSTGRKQKNDKNANGGANNTNTSAAKGSKGKKKKNPAPAQEAPPAPAHDPSSPKDRFAWSSFQAAPEPDALPMPPMFLGSDPGFAPATSDPSPAPSLPSPATIPSAGPAPAASGSSFFDQFGGGPTNPPAPAHPGSGAPPAGTPQPAPAAAQPMTANDLKRMLQIPTAPTEPPGGHPPG